MRIRPILQCVRTLDFAPMKPWPQGLPVLSWGAHLLVGFDRGNDVSVVDVAPEGGTLDGFAPVFCECYPRLTLPELARFRSRFLETYSQSVAFDGRCLDAVIEKIGMRPGAHLNETLEKIVATPLDFQKWAENRDLSIREFSILKSFSDLSELNPLLVELARANPTRSLGAQIFELCGELLLMGHSRSEISGYELDVPDSNTVSENDHSSSNKPTLSSENWLGRLQTMRRPLTKSREAIKSQVIMDLPWPKSFQPKLVRSGDQSAIEVKFQFTSAEDMKRKIESLSQVQEVLLSKSQKLETASECSKETP